MEEYVKLKNGDKLRMAAGDADDLCSRANTCRDTFCPNITYRVEPICDKNGQTGECFILKHDQMTKEAWLDGYCSAAIVVGLDTAHPTRKAILNRFWRRLKQETNNA